MNLLLALLLFFAPTTFFQGVEDPPTLEQARRHLDRGRFGKAEAAYRDILEADPGNGTAWYLLAYCLHQQGDTPGAIAANETALAAGGPRASILYNLACAHGVSGNLERGEELLSAAIDAGFLDFEQVLSDPELAGVRARGNLDLPVEHEFDRFRGRNGVELPWELLLPEGYDPERSYPAVVLLCPGGPLSASWFRGNLCDGDTRQQDCLVLLIAPPTRGWWTHPTHHALEDLLKRVRRDHSIEGNYHLVGFAEAGARPARTYSGMSGEFFDSLFLFAAQPFSGDSERDLRRRKDERIVFLLGEDDDAALADARRVIGVVEKAGRRASLRVLPATAEGVLPGLRHGRWLRLVREEIERFGDG